MKSIAAKIRSISGFTTDGAELVQQAFGSSTPFLAINSLRTETEKGEQRGFANLLVGLFGTIRNPLAHKPENRMGYVRAGCARYSNDSLSHPSKVRQGPSS